MIITIFLSGYKEGKVAFSLGEDQLKQIMQSHIYVCPNCGQRYAHKNNLLRHMKLQCGKEPQFQCQYCPKKCARKENLKLHVLNKHSYNEFVLM